ncbi:MAG: hypothetical protein IT348_18070, partial [Candidatus Eisenbacteria bacterium]|nr:hypothetical protein [Candidatus Eisenbacteria bacterium]
IPELFFIRNFADPTYGSLLPEGVRATRETWATIHGVPSDLAHGDAPRRLQVHEFLQREGWLRFNNGDPVLFNTLANSLQDSVAVLRQRGQLRQLGVSEYAAIAHRSVELVAEIQREIGRPEARRVGGRVHNLAVTPSGTYSSTSGDDT